MEKTVFSSIFFKGLFFIFVFSACTAGKDRTNIEWIQDMMNQPSIKDQTKGDEIKPMEPPDGVLAMNHNPYPYKDDLKGAIKNLKNPFYGKESQELLLIGKRSYQKACIYCHGKTGDAESAMKHLMIVRPPSLLSQKARDMKDSQIYHIIHEGQGVMGSYRLQVQSKKERWALVNYIRNLQKREAVR